MGTNTPSSEWMLFTSIIALETFVIIILVLELMNRSCN